MFILALIEEMDNLLGLMLWRENLWYLPLERIGAHGKQNPDFIIIYYYSSVGSSFSFSIILPKEASHCISGKELLLIL